MAIILAGCSAQRGFPPVHGIANFDRLDKKVYRGAQPSREALSELKNLGIVTVINLRQPDDTAPYEEPACDLFGIRYVSVPLSSIAAPSAAQIECVMRAIEFSSGPVFVHCQFGCDRTGTVCACWRIRTDGWPNAVALQEAVIYGMSDFEQGMKSFIRHYKYEKKRASIGVRYAGFPVDCFEQTR